MKTLAAIATVAFLLPAASLPPSESPSVCLGPEEKKLHTLLTEYRKSKGLPAIPLSVRLTKVAQLHARDLSQHYDFNNGKCNIHSWSKKGNWKACCYTNDHKEAACMWNKPKEITGYAGSGFEIAYYNSAGASAEDGLKVWKTSPGHNSVIINEGTWKQVKWNAAGIGIYKEYGVVWFGEVADEDLPTTCH